MSGSKIIKRSKLFKPFAIIATILGIAIAVTATVIFYQNSINNIRKEALEKIQTIAAMIDSDQVEQLNGDETDLDNPVYKTFLSEFRDIVDKNPELVYVYMMRLNDEGQIYFNVDSDTSDDQAEPGFVYSSPRETTWRTFNEGIPQFHGLTEGDNSDEWGSWVTALAPVKDDNGEVVAIVGMDMLRQAYTMRLIRDISLPILLALVFFIILFFYRLNNRRKLEQFDKEKQLLSVASHEVRSPMVSIKWVLENMLETDQDLTEKDRATILAVYNNSAKIISNIEGILSSTPSWSKKNHRMDNVYMKPLLLDIAGTLDLVAKQRRAKIVLDDTITDNLVVKGDRQNLHHAFYNVVNNALKYTYLDTDVIISYARTGKYHQFRVSDRGPGIKPEDRERIFEGLYRTPEAVTSKQPGTGLGLYFVKKIIANHGGKIYVDPEYSEGTCFVVELPV